MKKYELVIEYVKKSVQSRNLNVGDLLPSIRSMAKALGVSNITVNDAYCRLEKMKIVESEDRKGFILVDAEKLLGELSQDNDEPNVLSESELKVSHFRNSLKDNKEIVKLGALSPTNAYFPNDELSKYLTRTVRTNPDDMNLYYSPYAISGNSGFIEKMTAKFMFRTLGITVSEDNIFFTNGALDGLTCVLSAVTSPGDFVVIESPCIPSFYNICEYLNLVTLEIETSFPDGLNIDKLENLLMSGINKPKCLIVSPNFQNPTGALMPLENRTRLLEICKHYDVVVIEHDVFGALNFGNMLPSLKSMMSQDVIYVSSFSKILAPGYRVGWVCGGKYSLSIAVTQGLGTFAVMKASQETIAQFLEAGKMKTHLKKIKEIYMENSNKIYDAVMEYFPEGTELSKPEGGQFMWLVLPEHISVSDLYIKALENNILLAPGNLFTKRGNYDNCMRLTFALEVDDKVIEGIKLIGELAKTY